MMGRADTGLGSYTAPSESGVEPMEAGLFRKFAQIAYDQAGVHLKPGKESLVSARVAKRLRALDIPTPRAYLKYLEEDESGEEIVQFLDAITTNFTSFFREPDHFELLRDSLEEWVAAGQKKFRFWSAASSSGEEPYSIAMTVAEVLNGSFFDARILATDISTRVLRKASDGEYTSENVSGVPKFYLTKYFDRGSVKTKKGVDKKIYTVRPQLRELLTYRRLNLSKTPFPMNGPMDMVFCRNVMIYFDNTVRQRLVAEIERLLKPNGILVVGHTETLTSLRTRLKVIRPSVYRKPSR